MSIYKPFYTRRYGETEFYEIAKNCTQQSVQIEPLSSDTCDDSAAEIKALSKCANSYTAINRFKGAKSFIEAGKKFSEKHSVSADLYKTKCSVELWLYFTSEIVADERKEDLGALIHGSDELQMIPHPRGMPEWCDCALVLTYMTHRVIISKQ